MLTASTARHLRLALVVLGVLAIGGDALRAQVTPPSAPAVGLGGGVATDTIPVEGVTPGGAFLRSVVVPGWGHASIGSYLRGGFYLAAQGGTSWMLLRVRSRLASATARVEVLEEVETARLALAGIVDPVIVEDSLAANEEVADRRSLVRARQQQREDWLALGIFLILLGGADAYVSAHLKDFPAEPVFNATEDGRVEVGMRIPVGGG